MVTKFLLKDIATDGRTIGLEFRTRAPHEDYAGPIWFNKKEKPIMNTLKASYNGFTGELFKFERRSRFSEVAIYDLEIFDIEKNVTHSFYGVKLEDVKFLVGAVTFA